MRFNYLKKIKHYLHTLKQKQSINTVDVTLFIRQLATLISAGIPIIQSCELLEKSQEKIALKLLIHQLKREMLRGKNFSHSIKHHKQYFDDFTCELIQIGEHTGKLDTLLTTIALHKEKNLAFRNQVKRVLFYPCIISIVAIILTFSMFLFIVPHFAELFHDTQIKLPVLTICIFFLADQLNKNLCWFFLIIIICIGSMYFNHYFLSINISTKKIFLNLPFIKHFMHKLALTRFTRNLAITLSAGIPILESLKLTMNIHQNKTFCDNVALLRYKISTGIQLYQAMETLPYFPALVIQMIKVGEESGKLEYMLNKIADLLEADLEQFINHSHQLLEPLIMIVLGVLIGGMIIGMYLPIFKLGSAL